MTDDSGTFALAHVPLLPAGLVCYHGSHPKAGGVVAVRGRELALALRSQHGIRGILSDADLDDLMTELGVIVEERRFKSGVSELIVNDVVVLGTGLARSWRRWLKAHALGHHLLHSGNQLELPLLVQGHWERQVDEFAGWLIFGALPFSVSAGTVDAGILAEWADVPVECVRRWWVIVSEAGMLV